MKRVQQGLFLALTLSTGFVACDDNANKSPTPASISDGTASTNVQAVNVTHIELYKEVSGTYRYALVYSSTNNKISPTQVKSITMKPANGNTTDITEDCKTGTLDESTSNLLLAEFPGDITAGDLRPLEGSAIYSVIAVPELAAGKTDFIVTLQMSDGSTSEIQTSLTPKTTLQY